MSIRQLSKFYGCPDPWDHREANNSQYGVIVELTPSRGGSDGQRPGDVRPRGVGGGGRRAEGGGVFHISTHLCLCLSILPAPTRTEGGVVCFVEAQRALHDDTSTLFPSAVLHRRRIFSEHTSLRQRWVYTDIQCPWTLTLLPFKQHATYAAWDGLRRYVVMV